MTGDDLVGHVGPPALHVMTFNVRRRMGRLSWPAADRWSARAPRVQALLHAERPGVLGVQEAMPDQAAFLQDVLGSGFRSVGYGRSAQRSGEGCPLYYDHQRFELLDWAQQALSDHPDVAGSRTWGNPVPRVIVRAVLRDRSSGATFTALNTHWDPFSRASRLRAAEQLRGIVSAASTPVIAMGDLNAPAASSEVRALWDGGVMRDAWDTAADRLTPEWETYAAYRRPRVGTRRIDFIAVSTGLVVDRIAINARRYRGGWPSDHLPVQAVVLLAPDGTPA
ncbi:endonuclease/exonuclease/phosphatase family protein [Microbacterium sp. P02]|uniref:endonuclease/exonuclease/phosphatase family protein n=1 Tax=Microbacterium sp. P02 TaxID=3366260 RepID=UPI003671636B